MKVIAWGLLIFTCLSGSIQARKIPKYFSSANVVVFSPHPDDDILGCGGSLIGHVENGGHVTIVYLTSGDAAKWDLGPEDLARVREEEARRAAEMLGIEDLVFLQELDQIALFVIQISIYSGTRRANLHTGRIDSLF